MLTVERLKELLNYDSDSGIFMWRVPRRGIRLSKPAGTLDAKGYVIIFVDGQSYKAHRLAWLYVHGEWPPDQIDHINLIKDDNRIANLRPATNLQNTRNRVTGNRGSTSQYLGVSWNTAKGKWMAQIGLKGTNGGTRYLGLFDTEKAAHAAYLEAKSLLHEGGPLASE